jgi:hypothetical protein
MIAQRYNPLFRARRDAGIIKRTVKAAADPKVVGFPAMRKYEIDQAKKRLRRAYPSGGDAA